MDIVIADDHPILLEGVVSVLERSTVDAVFHKAENGLEALQKIIELEPEIAILDIEMPHLDGIEVAKKVRKANLSTKIIFLTFHKEPIFFHEIQKLNAEGYVLKEFSTLEIDTCVKEVLANNRYYGRGLEAFIQEKTSHLPEFTKTERHILNLIADGKTTKEISEMLFTSSKTVDSHRYNISKKLQLKPEKNNLLKWVLQNSHKIRG